MLGAKNLYENSGSTIKALLVVVFIKSSPDEL